MTRINFMLLFVVMASALYLVHVQYESRRLYTEFDRAQRETRRLEAEREQIEVERRRQATAQRIGQLAREQLGMRAATPAITNYVNYSAGGGAPTRVSGGRLAGGNTGVGGVNK